MFFLAASLLIVASFLDGLSTVYMIRRGQYEINPIMGKYPSKLRIFGLGGAIVAVEIAASAFVLWLCIVLIVQSAVHFYCAVSNYLCTRHSPVVR
jgi:hypothetical protein